MKKDLLSSQFFGNYLAAINVDTHIIDVTKKKILLSKQKRLSVCWGIENAESVNRPTQMSPEREINDGRTGACYYGSAQ